MSNKKRQYLLCFLHGWACSPTDFEFQREYFSDYPQLALDYTSTIKGNLASTPSFQACREALLTEIANVANGNAVVIIAHSLGGILSLAWLDSPQINIKGMVFLDSSLNIDEAKANAYKQLSGMIQTDNAADAIAGMFDAKMTISELDDAARMAKKKQEMINACLTQPRYLSDLLLGALNDKPHGILSQTKVPILYLGSANPYTSQQTLRTINTNIKFKQINQSGHFIMLNAPAEVNNHIDSFLSEIGSN